jgi:hypothetical protein
MSRPSTDNIAARVLGILVFLAGVALLGYVFATANTLFHLPPPHVPEPTSAATSAAAGSGAAPAAAAIAIGQSLSDYIKQLLALLLMCIAGSLVASKGIHLYFSAGHAHAAAQHAAAHQQRAPHP